MNRSEYMKAWRKKNPEKYRIQHAKDHRIHRLKKYGFTEESYEALLKAQNERCAICTKTSTRRLDIDHCHETNKVRGLLCNQCNQALGLFQDNPLILKSAIEYLGGVT